jgi:hypothetical protein
VDRHDAADRAAQLADGAGFGRGDGDGGLVGHHLDHRLVFGDDVADGDEPLDDLALGDAFPDVRKLELVGAHRD